MSKTEPVNRNSPKGDSIVCCKSLGGKKNRGPSSGGIEEKTDCNMRYLKAGGNKGGRRNMTEKNYASEILSLSRGGDRLLTWLRFGKY